MQSAIKLKPSGLFSVEIPFVVAAKKIFYDFV